MWEGEKKHVQYLVLGPWRPLGRVAFFFLGQPRGRLAFQRRVPALGRGRRGHVGRVGRVVVAAAADGVVVRGHVTVLVVAFFFVIIVVAASGVGSGRVWNDHHALTGVRGERPGLAPRRVLGDEGKIVNSRPGVVVIHTVLLVIVVRRILDVNVRYIVPLGCVHVRQDAI